MDDGRFKVEISAGTLGAFLRPSWAFFGASCDPLRLSSSREAVLEISLGALRLWWGSLGQFEPPRGHIEPTRRNPKLCDFDHVRCLGHPLDCPGASLEGSCGPPGVPWSLMEAPESLLRLFGRSLGNSWRFLGPCRAGSFSRGFTRHTPRALGNSGNPGVGALKDPTAF